jgi:predicted permease
VRALSPVVSERLHHIQGIGIHPMVLAFTLGVTALTGVLFGLAPALRATRVDLQRTLKEGGRTTGAAGGRKLNDAFVVAQFAFSLILLTGAGLLIRSFRNLLAIDPGFRPEHVLTARVSLPWPRYDEKRVHAFQDRFLEGLHAIPGTRAVAIAESVPFSQGDNQQEFVIEGNEPAPNDPIPVTSVWAVSPGYFEALGTPLLDGRAFNEADRDSAPQVIIIDRTMADRYWPGGGAIGQRIRLGGRTGDNHWATIVGLAGEIRHQNLGDAPNYRVYLPIAQHTRWRTRVAVRAEGDPLALTRQVREAVRAIDPELPVFGFETMEQSVANSLSTERLTNRLLLGFAGVALLLAAIGIYGVMSLNVGSRIGEFGIRMALGASPGQVKRLVVRHGLALVLPGVVFGLAGAAALTRFLGSLLFGVKPIDPLTFALVTGLLLIVAAAACWVPARRAVSSDPLTALRGE